MLGGIVIVLWMAVGHGLTAILDPMTAMRDDISRIKVMMETVGGPSYLIDFKPTECDQ